jgi:hypothetical protein
VTVRLTAHEADQLQRLAGQGPRRRQESLSEAVRRALTSYIHMITGGRGLPDTQDALIRREVRKAKLVQAPEDTGLLQAFDLEEATSADDIRIAELETKMDLDDAHHTRVLAHRLQEAATKEMRALADERPHILPSAPVGRGRPVVPAAP